MEGILSIVAAVVAFGITAGSGIFMIPYLRKLKYGQTIKEIGPTWHQKKQGTPTMGGVMFIVGIVAACLLAFSLSFVGGGVQRTALDMIRLFAGLGLAVGMGLMGFVDDYIKVVKKRNLGLRAREKLIIQLVLTVGYLFILHMAGADTTIVDIPFLGQLDLGFFYYPIMILFIILTVNAVNLTDGIDGLASSVTFVAAIAFTVICLQLQNTYLGVMAVALAAGCLGFLVWNFHPAKVFMGDTGSMFLGGMVVALAFGINQPIILVLIGIIYFVEAFSVILQVISFKLTGKRLFKMSPIHHHFEMSGWSEVKIVVVFSLVTVIFSAVAYGAILYLFR